jgi:uncharacterized damage-inducible protein DinB
MSTDAEVHNYAEIIRGLVHEIGEAVDGLTDEQVNWDPLWHDSNSLYIIATHALECTRSYVLNIVCGLPVGRDRPAEFRAAGSAAELGALAHELSAEIDKALSELDRERLSHHAVPPQEIWGQGQPREISGRWALAHMIEHMGIHLGQMHVTRDLAQLEVQG